VYDIVLVSKLFPRSRKVPAAD